MDGDPAPPQIPQIRIFGEVADVRRRSVKAPIALAYGVIPVPWVEVVGRLICPAAPMWAGSSALIIRHTSSLPPTRQGPGSCASQDWEITKLGDRPATRFGRMPDGGSLR